MWYVIQVKTGEETEVKTFLDKFRTEGAYTKCFIPLFEDVRRSGGKCRIGFRKLFPGYVFIDSEDPERTFEILRTVPRFTRLLGYDESDGEKLFLPISTEDQAFLQTLFGDGLMHLSYVHISKNGRIDRVTGPLANYRNHITKLELRHRTAIVETEMFGKQRRVKFSFWTDDDPTLPEIEKLKNEAAGSDVLDGVVELDVGIHPGDYVVDETGVYGNQVFLVQKVDIAHRTVLSTFEMFGTQARLELRLDDVGRVDGIVNNVQI